MLRKLLSWVLLVAVLAAGVGGAEARRLSGSAKTPRLLFIAHDSRPISNEQTADNLRAIGWDIVAPPLELLGNRTNLGDPDAVWAWLNAEAKHAQIAVLSADTLLYGSLVGSRRHDVDLATLESRVKRFAELHKAHPRLRLYVFGSIMRTPRTPEASGGNEPAYYQGYGGDIFRYTALIDKQETDGLSRRERKELAFLTRLIPREAIDDWLSRHQKNFTVNQRLIDLARNGTFDYLALGRDDNAPYSQTHMESRKLSEYGSSLSASQFQAMAGIDEFAMLMLTRAVNDWTSSVPFVYVRYNYGKGGETVPAYSDEKISESIKSQVRAAGGYLVPTPERADFSLFVNTNPNGKTLEANARTNDEQPRDGTVYFADIVAESLAANRPTCVADIAYANGSDNALMELLKGRGLLFKLRAYAGWNTATNSAGFVLSQGMLATKMPDAALDRLLLVRYLDDWAYQANIRAFVARQLGWLRASGSYADLGERRRAAEDRATRLVQRFAEDRMPPFEELGRLRLAFPWDRMFEADIRFDNPR